MEAHGRLVDRFLRGNPFTKAGVDTALWDALGRTLGRAGRDAARRAVPPRSAGQDLAQRRRRRPRRRGYETAVELGFRAFKVKVGRDPDTDATRVALARELAGPDALLGVDANGGWSRADAERAVRETEPHASRSSSSRWRRPTSRGWRSSASLGLLAVVADEAVYTRGRRRARRPGRRRGRRQHLRRQELRASSVRCGPRRLAASHGLGVVIGSNGEMGIGAAAQLHVACACEQLGPIPCGIIGHHFYEDESTLETPLDIDGRRAVLTTGPGLGVEPAAEIARRFA